MRMVSARVMALIVEDEQVLENSWIDRLHIGSSGRNEIFLAVKEQLSTFMNTPLFCICSCIIHELNH